MSIIYEALKKIEKTKNFLRPAEMQTNSGSAGKDKKGKVSLNKIILLLPIVSFAVLVLFWLSFKADNNKIKSSSLVTRIKKEANAKQARRFLKSKDKNLSKYILEGIIYDKDSPTALINGRIVKKLDRIGVFTVLDISKNEVELSSGDDSTKLTLSLSR